MAPILLFGLLALLGLFSVWTGNYTLPLVLTAALPIGWAVLKRPAWAAAVTLASASWSLELVPGSTITPFKLMLVSTSGIMAMGLLSGGALPRPRGHWPVLYAIFIVWAMLIDIGYAQNGMDLVRVGGVVLTLMVFAHGIKARKDIDVVVVVLLALLALMALDLFRELGLGWWLGSKVIRGAGLVGNPNGTAQTALGVAGLALALSALASLPRLPVVLAVFTSLVLVLFMTVSRGAVVAVAVGLVVFAFTFPRTIRQRLSTLAAIAAVVTVFLVAMPAAFEARMVQTVETDRGSGSVTIDDSSRTELNLIAVDLILDNPFFGVGTEGFPLASERLIGLPYVCHNSYLGAGAAYGMLGFALVVLLMLWTPVLCFVQLRRAPDEERLFWSSYLAMGVAYAAMAASLPLLVTPLQAVIGSMPSLLLGTILARAPTNYGRRDAIARERAALRSRLADQHRA